jgi:hypothetical protein
MGMPVASEADDMSGWTLKASDVGDALEPWGKRRSGVGHVAVRMGASRVACGFERRLLSPKTGRMDVGVRVRDAIRVTCPTAPFVRGASTGARDPRRRLMRPVVAFV